MAFTAAVAIWLYEWQSERTARARRTELRTAQYISIFNMWDQLKDANLQSADLPDGSKEKVLLTFLQPTIFEESIRSGLFGANDTALLSRLVGSIRAYNDSVSSFVTFAKSVPSMDRIKTATGWDVQQRDTLRNMIYTIQENRENVVDVSKRLLSTWPFEELSVAIAAADSGHEADPNVAQLIAGIQEENFKISPGGHKAALYAKLEEAKETAKRDAAAACASLTDLATEAQALADKKITPEEAERLISEVQATKWGLGCD